MAEDKKESWLNFLALTTVILAVCATLSTFKGGGYSTKSVMSQTQASDQWSFFQSKSIKSYIYEMQRDKLQLELKTLGGKMSKDAAVEYEKRIDDYSKKIEKYDKENPRSRAKQNALNRYEMTHRSILRYSALLSSICR